MKAKSKQVKYALNRPLEFFTNKVLKKQRLGIAQLQNNIYNIQYLTYNKKTKLCIIN